MWTVFLDRDGVINRKAPDGEYISSWQSFVWLPGAITALGRLALLQARIIVVTNQQGVAKGHMQLQDVEAIHRHMMDELRRRKARVDAVFVCPHAAGTCSCRKPDVGLFLKARQQFPEISFARAVVVGDSPSDVEAGRRLGAWTILLGARLRVFPPSKHGEAPDLLSAVAHIIEPLASELP